MTGDVPRLGIVGLENSHAAQIVRHLNTDERGTRARVVALVGEPDEANLGLARRGCIETLVPRSIDLLGQIDALVVANRNGGRHRAEAEPFLDAGVPVWVDKPLACSVEDADALVAAASPGQLTSYSALRWVADTRALAAELDSIGPLQSLTVTGPADRDSEHGGIFFYGIHCADLAQALDPGVPGEVTATTHGDTVRLRYRVGEVEHTLNLVRPEGERRAPFHVLAIGRHGVLGREIGLGADYCEPGISAFLAMLASGVPAVPPESLRHPIDVLAQADAALSTDGVGFSRRTD